MSDGTYIPIFKTLLFPNKLHCYLKTIFLYVSDLDSCYQSTQVCFCKKDQEPTNITTGLGSRNFIYINDCYHISSLFTKVSFSYMKKETDFRLTTGCTDRLSLSSSSWPTTRKNVCVIECRMLRFQCDTQHLKWHTTIRHSCVQLLYVVSHCHA